MNKSQYEAWALGTFVRAAVGPVEVEEPATKEDTETEEPEPKEEYDAAMEGKEVETQEENPGDLRE